MGAPLRFGVFLAPFHSPSRNPSLALHRDLELIQHLDALGHDEAWIAEHHSGGFGAFLCMAHDRADRHRETFVGAATTAVLKAVHDHYADRPARPGQG